MRGLGSIPTGGGKIFHWIFFCFHVVKSPMPILAHPYSLDDTSLLLSVFGDFLPAITMLITQIINSCK